MVKPNDEKFFEQYQERCEACSNGGKVVIPKPDPFNATKRVEVVFINERPGPIGPRKSGYISFDNPDESAKFFKELFCETFGLNYRERILITNACLWYPDLPNYRNRTPTATEINCGLPILKDQIDCLKPLLIVTVGARALGAVRKLYPSKKLQKARLKTHVGILIDDTPIPVFPVYHTSLLGRTHRSREKQKRDWMKLKEALKILEKNKEGRLL